MQIFSGFDINAHSFISGGVIAGIMANAGVANHAEAFFVVLAIVLRHGADLIIAGVEAMGRYLKRNGFAIAIARKGERRLRWGRRPTRWKTQAHGTFGRALDVATQTTGERE